MERVLIIKLKYLCKDNKQKIKYTFSSMSYLLIS